MDQRTLEKLILTVISASFVSSDTYPDPYVIQRFLMEQGKNVTPEEVL